MAEQSYPNPDLEIASHLVLQGRIIPQETEEQMATAVEQPQFTRPPRIDLEKIEMVGGG